MSAAVVLHRTLYPRNLGQCARAMTNMGIDRLILIAPACDPNSFEARQGAVHAQTILKNATVYESLNTFFSSEGSGLNIALSGKAKRASKLSTALWSDFSGSLYFHFGPEDDGLNSDELSLMNQVVTLPTFGTEPSLNLAHAVLLTTFIFSSSKPKVFGEPLAPPSPRLFPHASLRNWLETIGLDLSSPKSNIEKTMQRILLSKNPSNDELRILDKVLQQTVRLLRKESDKF